MNKRSVWVATFLLLVVLLSGCTLFRPKMGIVNVKVALDDGTVMPGVKVTAISKKESIEAETDENGVAKIEAKAGTYTLSAEFVLFNRKATEVKKEAKVIADKETNVEFIAEGLGNITITFEDDDKDPLANVAVVMKLGDDSGKFTTDKDGKIRFFAKADTYLYEATYKTLDSQKGEIELKGGLVEKVVTLDTTGDIPKKMVVPAEINKLVPTYLDEFDNLDNWTEHKELPYNQWLLIDEGKLTIEDGKLKRTEKVAATSSGLKLNDILVKDGAVSVHLSVSEDEEYAVGNLGIRLHLRNPEDSFCYGYGLNVSTYGYELATWHGKDASPAKTALVNPGNVLSIKRGDTTTITLVLEGDTYKYYRDGELIAETTAEEGYTFAEGGIFLVLTEGIEIDSLAYFEL